MYPFKILYVDDEEINLLNLRLSFEQDYQIITACSGQEGLDIFSQDKDIGLVISDHRMPGMTGVEMLTEMYKMNPESIRIILTAYSKAENIMDAINQGHIYQYIMKPWDHFDLKLIIEHAKTAYTLRMENKSLTIKLAEKNTNLLEVNEKLMIVNEVLKADIKRRQKVEHCLKESEENLLNSKQRLRELSGALLSAQDNERRRIAMELHDELGQSMAVLKLHISSIKNQLNSSEELDKEHIRDRLEELRLLINDLIESTRNLSRELWPMMVDDLGIDAAFDNLSSSFLNISGLKTKMHNSGIRLLLSIERQRHLYRIVQESLNNVIKHAKAQNLTVCIDSLEDTIKIDIEDDGVGFDVDSVLKRTGINRGIGLQSISERIKMLDGILEVESSPGKGTSLHFTLPVENKKTDGTEDTIPLQSQ